MKVQAITLIGNDISENGFKVLCKSSDQVGNDFNIEKFMAYTESNVVSVMKSHDLKWNWPWSGTIMDSETGLRKHSYGGRVKERRMACALSHWHLWDVCHSFNEPMLILEHDALFLEKLDYQKILDSKYGIVGLNNPHGATRLPGKFDEVVRKGMDDIIDVPKIDDDKVPQGLAGNSAYIIKPWAAEKLLSKVYRYGMWPNDAIMCKQLLPDILGVTTKYYTKVQGLRSTTGG